MSARVVSIEERRPAGRYYDPARYAYYLMRYVSVGDLFVALFGVSLISAAPFFYLFITHDLLPCVVYTANAAAGAAVGVRQFVKTLDRAPRRAPAGRTPRAPSVAHRRLQAV